MPPTAFPRLHLRSLHELASTILERHARGSDNETLARDLLAGFFDVCMRSGLDGVLVGLEQTFAPLDVTDGSTLGADPRLRSALAEKLGKKAEFDPGGPRNAKPGQLADCLIAVLSLTLSDEPDRTLTFSDHVRAEIVAALTVVIEAEFAAPKIRAAILAKGRELCEERYLDAFDRISAQLDERGMRMTRQPKIPLDSVQAVQRVLFEARHTIVEQAAHAAIDRAKLALARVSSEASARIDLPITHRMTPRDVAIRRVTDPQVSKVPAAVVHSLFESLTETAQLAWRPLEQPVRAYAASQTFAVGDLVDHPKFGRGSVRSTEAQRIEVEFAEGSHTLVHGRASK